MAGVKNAKAPLAWLLLSSLNRCPDFRVFQISPAYFIHNDAAFQTFLETVPMYRNIRVLMLSGEKRVTRWYDDDRCRETVERLALQCALGCPRLQLACTGIPDRVADRNDYRRLTKQLTLFKREGRSVIEKSSSKKEAVEVLVKFRNELCCLHIALLMNLALFFSMM